MSSTLTKNEDLPPHQNSQKKMASVIESKNHNHILKGFYPHILRQIRRTKPDLCRLASFKTWKTNTNCIISPAVLAKVGFYYTGKGDLVRCESCNIEIDSWKPGMDPKQEHMERSPQCPFVLDQQELFSKNGIVIRINSDY